MKKNKLLQTTWTKKMKKVNKFFNITKEHKSKEKFHSANMVCRCSQNNTRVIIS